MKKRFAAPVAERGDRPHPARRLQRRRKRHGSTTLAKGEVNFVDSAPSSASDDGHHRRRTGRRGDRRGPVQPRRATLALQCADTDTDGLVILGGEATADAGDSATVGDRVAVIIREGDPDGAVLWYELPLPEGEVAAGSCREFLDSIPHDQFTGDNPLADVAEGDDIETG